MTHTTNLNLNKPDLNDNVNVVTDINDNMDLIDAAYGALNSKLINGDWTTITVDNNNSYTMPDNGVVYFYIPAYDTNPGYISYTLSTWRTIRINVYSGFSETMYVNVCKGDVLAYTASSNIGSPLVQFRKMY